MPELVDKACPVLLRRQQEQVQILAFRHPLAGCQIVKGTVDNGEQPSAAVLRELGEESGIEDARLVAPLGQLIVRGEKQRWHIFLCQVERRLPDKWSFYTQDDGGHDFAFFWHNLDELPGDEWNPVFPKVLAFIQKRIDEKDATAKHIIQSG